MRIYEVNYRKGDAHLVCLYASRRMAQKHRNHVIAVNGEGENLEPFDGNQARGTVDASVIREISVDSV